jgi:hypothetical protein
MAVTAWASTCCCSPDAPQGFATATAAYAPAVMGLIQFQAPAAIFLAQICESFSDLFMLSSLCLLFCCHVLFPAAIELWQQI